MKDGVLRAHPVLGTDFDDPRCEVLKREMAGAIYDYFYRTLYSRESERAGDNLFKFHGASNTDEDGLPDAGEVKFDRQSCRHFSFGGGVHRCLGPNLASSYELRCGCGIPASRTTGSRLVSSACLRRPSALLHLPDGPRRADVAPASSLTIPRWGCTLRIAS
jgi:hypothetical protein